MSNILQNSNFDAWKHLQTFLTDEFHTLVWEQPDHWTVFADKQADSHVTRVPQFLHDDLKGFKISAGYIKFLAGMRQRVFVQGGQRYVFKATIEPHVHQGAANTPPTPQSVEWRLEARGAMDDFGAWGSLTTLEGRDNGQVRDVLWVIQPAYDGYVDVAFVVRNVWGAGVSEVFTHYIGVEPVASDYGGDGFTVIEPYLGTPPGENPEPVPVPTPTPTPTPLPMPFPSEVTVNVKFEIGANLLTLMLALLNRQVNGGPDGQQTP